MRLRAVLFAAVVLAGFGAGAVKLAETATAWVEATTGEHLAAGLDAAGQDWASVAVDGLEGHARRRRTGRDQPVPRARSRPSRSSTRAGSPTPPRSTPPRWPRPPAFALELLRNDAEVSLIGLVPETGGRDVILAALRAGGLDDNVADMLESASDPAPDGWREALGYGLAVLAELPRAKISVAPGSARRDLGRRQRGRPRRARGPAARAPRPTACARRSTSPRRAR